MRVPEINIVHFRAVTKLECLADVIELDGGTPRTCENRKVKVMKASGASHRLPFVETAALKIDLRGGPEQLHYTRRRHGQIQSQPWRGD